MRFPSDSSDADARLIELLTSLRVEQSREADFEERFLYEFHERVAREAVCCPARHRLLEHLMQMLTNFGRRRIAYGASTLGIGVLAVGGYFVMPGEDSAHPVSAAAANRFDSGISSLSTGLARDYDACTRVQVEQEAGSLDRDKILVIRHGSFGAQNTFTSSSYREESPWNEPQRPASEPYAVPMYIPF